MTKNESIMKMAWDLANHFRGETGDFAKAVASAYLAYLMKEKGAEAGLNEHSDVILGLISDEQIRLFVKQSLTGDDMQAVFSLLQFSKKDLKTFLLHAEEYWGSKEDVNSTPACICRLVGKILNIQPQEKVLDNCSGLGAFLIQSYENQPSAEYFGVELNRDVVAMSKIKTSLTEGQFNIVEGNGLNKNFQDSSFDKIFAHYPFGLRLRSVRAEELTQDLFEKYSELTNSISSDWIFNFRLCQMLSENGTGVAVTTLGSLVNTTDKLPRKLFVENDQVKAVIKLPAKLFSYTSIQCALVVFGTNTEGRIRFIDASQQFVAGRRQNDLSEENISQILSMLQQEGDYSCEAGYDEIAEKQYSLDPSRYLEEERIKDGVRFSEVIEKITRGAPCTARELDAITSSVPTNFQYLMLTNIRSGDVQEPLPYLKEIPEKYQKYCIGEGDILLSKNGYPFKVAVASPRAGQQVLANGNLYVIALDREKVDPYYIKAFLESEKGIAQLKKLSVGTTMPNIGVAQLNTLVIPMRPLEEQKEIALQYRTALERIKALRMELEDEESALKTLFPTE